MDINEKIISIIKKSVYKADSDAKIILYGSRARGDAKSNSDWDIIVIVNNNKTPEENYNDIAYPLLTKGIDMGVEINAIVYSEEQWNKRKPTLFRHNILKDGIML